jgi:hypothetical protein
MKMSDAERKNPFQDNSEILFRQLSPKIWQQDGKVSNLAFEPTKAHKFLLSTAQGSKCTAEEAFKFHTETKQLDSVGTWGITVAEIKDDNLPIIDDADEINPFHASIDFNGLSNSQRATKGKNLREKALKRGKLFPPAS